MKVAIITDMHWGVRNDSDFVYQNQKRFYEELFFPYLKKHDIKHVINGGDITDRRKYINFKTLNRLRKEYIDVLESMGVKQHNIIGNHDVFYKNTNEINSLSELFNDKPIDNFNIYTEVQHVEIDGRKILMVPWINRENEDESLKRILESDAEIAIGHLEISGFQMYSFSIPYPHGYGADLFNNFKMVLSGHFHHKSKKGNIQYLGSPSQYTWSDHGDKRGFHVLDTDTLELEYIENPFTLFHKFYYNDENIKSPVDRKKMINKVKAAAADKKGCYIKLIVEKKDNEKLYDNILDIMYAADFADFKIVDNLILDVDVDGAIDQEEAKKDTLTIMKENVDEQELKDEDKKSLKILFENLHRSAQLLED